MATRTIPLTVESGGYTTAGSGEWVAFFPNYNNDSFGNNNPTSYSITFNTSYLYANYSSNVTMQWKLKFKIGGTWYTIYTGSKTMKKTSSDFSSSGSLSSDVITALKNNSISEVGVYQNGSRVIKGTSSATGTLTISYDEVSPLIVWSNKNLSLSQRNDFKIDVSWNPATIQNGSGTITYYLYCDTEDNVVWSGTSTSTTITPPDYGSSHAYYMMAYCSSTDNEMAWSNTINFTAQLPSITAQPTISTISPSSGTSTTITWSAATVSNKYGATIYYQYFVGPSSTYSDSYHIGTTTSLSANITEAQILSKCGDGFGSSTSGGTCYLFVRAYWDYNGNNGGWYTPSSKPFTYYPTINSPTNFSINPTHGQSTTLSWTNVKASNNSSCQIILFIDGTQVASNIQDSNSGYLLDKTILENFNYGTHNIKIAYEWYGRYAYSNELIFNYSQSYRTLKYFTGTEWKECRIYYYDGSSWIAVNPYYYTGNEWRECSVT